MPSPVKTRQWIGRTGWLLLLSIAIAGVVPVALAQVEAEAPAAVSSEEAIRAEVDRLFRVLRLRDGVLLEPRSDMDGIAAIEIAGGAFVIDGNPVSSSELDARLGSVADVVRSLRQLEARSRPDTFGGDDSKSARSAPAPAPDAPRAPPPPRRHGSRMRNDSQVVVGSSVVIEADEESRDVVVFGGRLTVRGVVIGDAVAIGGSVVLERGGRVTGDLAAIGGPATLEADTEVQGDVISVGNEVRIDDSATVGGKVVEVPFGPQISFGWPDSGDWDFDWDDDWWDSGHRGMWGFGRVFNVFWNFFGLLFLALLACLAYLLARGPIERMAGKVRAEPWKAGLVGFVAQLLFVPLLALVCLILLISIIGIPLLALVPFAVLALILASFLGYTAVALSLGGWTERRFGWAMVNPYVAIVVGVGLIQVISFTGDLLELLPGPLWLFALMFIVFGAVIKYLAWTVGLGAALLTRFGTLEDPSGSAQAALPPLPSTDAPSESWDQPAESEELPDLRWDGATDGTDTGEQPWEPDVEGDKPDEPDLKAG